MICRFQCSLGVIVLLASCLLLGCATTTAEKTDEPEPSPETVTVDFEPIFSETRFQGSTILMPRARDALGTVMVSPNVVMESSRSSLDEPDIEPQEEGNRLHDAMGTRIDFKLSTLLLNYLRRQGVTLIAPVMSFRWYGISCWQSDECRNATWVERVLQMHRRYEPAEGDDSPVALPHGADEERRYAPIRPRGQREATLPTSAFGVRALGVDIVPKQGQVIARGDRYVVQAATEGVSGGVCRDLDLMIPVVRFEGELVEMEEGRLIARIHERAPLELEGELSKEVRRYRYEPVEETAYHRINRITGNPVAGTQYTYVDDWKEIPVLCDRIRQETEDLTVQLLEDLDERELAEILIEESLDSLDW